MYPNGPHIEKDATITKMRMDAFQAIEAIAKEAFPEYKVPDKHEIMFVSFEDAIKELAQIKKGQFV